MQVKTKNSVLIVLVVIIASLLPAIIFGKYIEAVIFFFSHWFIREQFPLQYHHIRHSICRIITASIMIFGICFILPLKFSIISAIPICYFIAWVGFVKKTSDINEVKLNRLKQKLDNSADKLFIEKCRNANLSKRDTEIAFKYFIEKQKPKDIWLWLCENKNYEYIEWDSVHQLLWRISKKLK